MMDFLYGTFIQPAIKSVEILFEFFYALTQSFGVSIILFAIVLNIILSPLIRKAHRKEEQITATQKRMAPKIKSIKKAFSGEEQISMLNVLYRQNNYNPLYSFLGNASLLIQVPFLLILFILFSDYPALKGESFLFLQDLFLPDSLLFGINVLPILMLGLNLLALVIHSKKEPISTFSYLIPLLFFVIVYNMPSILLLFWITNNIFFLFPNRNKKAYEGIYLFLYQSLLLFLFLLVMNFSWLHFAPNIENIYILSIFLLLLSTIITAVLKLFVDILKQAHLFTALHENAKLFYWTVWTLFVYVYVVFSSFFVATPDILVFGSSFIQALFVESLSYLIVSVFLAFIVYTLLDSIQKKFALLLASFLLLLLTLNAFILHGDYGLLDTFTFSKSARLELNVMSILIDGLVILLLSFVAYILIKTYQSFYYKLLLVLNITAFVTLGLNAYNLLGLLQEQKSQFKQNQSQTLFHYSKEGKNIVVLMLDRGFGGFIPDVFNDEPELKSKFDGFTWYPNTLSTSNNTLGGLPTIFAGKDYNVKNLSAVKMDLPLNKKRDAAYKLLADNFTQKEYDVLYFAPSFAGEILSGDCSIFNHDSFECYNTFKTPVSQKTRKSQYIKSKMFRQLMTLSLFKSAPSLLKPAIYEKGNWLGNSAFQIIATDMYKTYKENLETLPKISDTRAKSSNTFKFITNMITHSPAFVDSKCNMVTALKKERIERFENVLTAKHFDSTVCSMQLLSDYFQWFKDNGIYDNTMFILVSDHAYPMYNPMLKKATGKSDRTFSYYHSLLMVKPFKAKGAIQTNFTRRMNYEVPNIVCKEIGTCYDYFFEKKLSQASIPKSITVYDTPWLYERQNKNSYIINQEYELTFPFNANNTDPL